MCFFRNALRYEIEQRSKEMNDESNESNARAIGTEMF